MNSRSTGLVILNTVTLILMLFVNFASNTNVLSDHTVADISHKYDTLFAPAGYAFLVWFIIFLQAISFVVYQWVLLKKGDTKDFIKRAGIWFSLANIANAAWIYFWINEKTGWAAIIIFILLTSLIMLTKNLRLELDDEPVKNIFFVWWPVAIYLGWIMVASIACTASWLVSVQWNALGISQNIWTIILMAAACLLYILLIQKRNMRESAMIGVWAFVAIAVRQWNTHTGIVICALAFAGLLVILSAIHVYKNKHYTIGNKLKRGEW